MPVALSAPQGTGLGAAQAAGASPQATATAPGVPTNQVPLGVVERGFEPAAHTLPRQPLFMSTQVHVPEPPGLSDMEVAMASLEASPGQQVAPKSSSKIHSPREAFRKVDNRKGVNLEYLADRYEMAKTAGVNASKRSFFQKLGGAVAVGLVAAGVLAVGALTGGGLLAVGGIAGVFALRLAADAWCAQKLYQNALAQAKGLEPPHALPMGTNAVANLVFKLCPSTWATPVREKLGRCISGAVDATIFVAGSLASGTGLPFLAGGLILVGVHHSLESVMRGQPAVEHQIRNMAQHSPSPLAVAPPAGGASNAEPVVLEGRLLEIANALAELKALMGGLRPSPRQAALAQELEASEKALDEQFTHMAELLEELPFEVYQTALRSENPAKQAVIDGALTVADILEETGMGVVDIGVGFLKVARGIVQLNKEIKQLGNAGQLLLAHNSEFASLRNRLLDEQTMQRRQSTTDLQGLSMAQTMVHMQHAIRV